jgi:hypothetical protein
VHLCVCRFFVFFSSSGKKIGAFFSSILVLCICEPQPHHFCSIVIDAQVCDCNVDVMMV